MPLTASRALIRQTERWFVRRGVPQMIAGYDFRRHILPRIVPFLAVLAIANIAYFIAIDASPARRIVIAAVAVLAALVVWWLLRASTRRLPRLSRPAAITLLVVYTVALAAAALVVLRDRPALAALTLAGYAAGVAVAFAGAYLTVTYGLLALVRSALVHAVDDMRNSLRLQSRALPMLLFVTLFFFFTGELWQAMNRLSWGRVGLVLALFAAVTILAIAGRLRDEIGRVEQDLRPERLSEACQGTPLADVDIGDIAQDGPLAPVGLTNGQQVNLLVLLATRQLVQAAVVGLGLFAFFVLLGILVVEPETAEQWIGAPPVMYAGVPAALLRNAVLLAGFGSMYFAVTSMSDADNRHQFFAPILDEVERILAVHAVYLSVRDVVLPPPPNPPVDPAAPHGLADGPPPAAAADAQPTPPREPAPHEDAVLAPDPAAPHGLADGPPPAAAADAQPTDEPTPPREPAPHEDAALAPDPAAAADARDRPTSRHRRANPRRTGTPLPRTTRRHRPTKTPPGETPEPIPSPAGEPGGSDEPPARGAGGPPPRR